VRLLAVSVAAFTFDGLVTVPVSADEDNFTSEPAGTFPFFAAIANTLVVPVGAWENGPPAVGDPWLFVAPPTSLVPVAPATSFASAAGFISP
jgi:hypothetical protein